MRPEVESELFRAMLLARLRLLKSRHRLKVEEIASTRYCFSVAVLDQGITFLVQLELLPGGSASKAEQIHRMEAQRMLKAGSVSMPVMLMLIDPVLEEGLVDFLILPDLGADLMVNPSLELRKLTSSAIDMAIDRLILGYDNHASKAS